MPEESGVLTFPIRKLPIALECPSCRLSQVKQGWHLNEKTFMPTSNARNSAMLKEAATFADHLKHCEKDIRNLKNSSEGEANHLCAPIRLCLGGATSAMPLRTDRELDAP